MKIKAVNRWLQLGAAVLWVLAGASALLGWRSAYTATFGLVAALVSVAAFFTGNRVAALLENKIESLESEQRGRVLTSAQLQALTEQLRPLTRSNDTVHLMGLQGNVESIRLANVLKAAFQSAGFVVDGVWESVLLGSTGPGILVRQEKIDDLGTGIRDALTQAGLDSRVVELGHHAQGIAEVIVCYKA